MPDPEQSEGGKAYCAMPGDKPDQTTSDADVKRTGEASRRKAGPDGPDATEVGDTFKRSPH